jgi:hypothetical protein
MAHLREELTAILPAAYQARKSFPLLRVGLVNQRRPTLDRESRRR